MSEEKVGYYSVMDAAMDKLKPEVCEWEYVDGPDFGDGYWKTSCDNVWYFVEGTPAENHIKYCPFCGKLIAQVPATR